MRAVIRQTWLCAMRDRLLAILMLALLAIVALSAFLADQSLIEQHETATAFIAFAARLLIGPALGLCTILLVRRAFESGDGLLQLSRPLSRPAYVLGIFLGLLSMVVLLTVAACSGVWLAGHPAPARILAWGAGLLAESSVIIAFSLFAALGLSSVIGAFSLTLSFYLLARLSGVIGAIVGSDLHERTSLADTIITKTAHGIMLLLPRLDLFSDAWLIQPTASFASFLLQVITYCALLLVAASFDLQRRRF